MSHQVFVSHSSKDKIAADAIVAHLERSGLKCWVAPRDILPGTSWASSIMGGIANARVMVLVFSDHANTSEHVRNEVERAVFHGIPIAPVRIRDVIPSGDLEYFLGRAHWMDAMTPPFERHLEELAQKLSALIGLPVTVQTREPATAATATLFKRKSMVLAMLAAMIVVAVVSAAIYLHGLSRQNSDVASHSPAVRDAANSLPTKLGETCTNSLGMKFAFIPAGDFMMGSAALPKEPDQYDDEPQHHVILTKKFMMQTTHVTRGQFAAFIADSGYRTDAERQGFACIFTGEHVEGASWKNPGFDQQDDHPAVDVSWNDATAFAVWLGKKTGKNYRLPTEAEYEYCCRAGTTQTYPWGTRPNDGAGWANCTDQSTKAKFPDWNAFSWNDGYVFTSPVGKFKANPWGIYDMIGNAWEWCEDWYGRYSTDDATDPQGPKAGAARILRGGSWIGDPRSCRCANRNKNQPDSKFNFYGFRLVLDFENP